MTIKLTDTGKRFNREWIFRHLNAQFEGPGQFAIVGPNGSGKSTLLQVIAGATPTSEGSCQFTNAHGHVIPDEQVFQHIALAAPYLELIEEMTANELLRFHQSFKPLIRQPDDILQAVALSAASNKQIRYYSSGMKQRMKLALAFFSDAPVLLLDEPTANLDAAGATLYHQLLTNFAADRLVLIASNDPNEYVNATQVLGLSDFK